MNQKNTKKEMMFYMFFCLGTSLFFNLATNYINLFSTDMGITATSVALITAVAQIWDAVNDPAFGSIIDRQYFKSGKYKPWVKMSAIALPVSAVFLFALPVGLNATAKFVWVLIGYVVYRTAFTIADIPQFGVVTVMTDNIQERNVIMGTRNIGGILAVTAVAVLGPALYINFGWFTTGLVFSVLGFILMFPFHRTLKERSLEPQKEKLPIRTMIQVMKSNRYLILFFIGVIISQATNSILLILAYFSRYCLKNDGYTTVVFLMILIPTFVSAIFLPRIQEKVDKFILLYMSLIGSAITGVIHYFIGYDNFLLFCMIMIVRGFFIGAQAMLLYTFTSNIVEYGHFTTGKRVEALFFSLQTFCAKMTSAFCGALTMVLLGSAGFIEGMNAVQPASVSEILWFFMTIFPAIGIVISMIPFSFYRLSDSDVQIMTMANNGQITVEEAHQQLNGKYALTLNRKIERLQE